MAMNNTDSPANNKKSIVKYIVLALTLAVETMVADWEIRLMVASVAIAMMVVVVWYHTWKTSFSDSVVAKIKKSKVLQCEADGEDIVVNNGEIVLKAKLINRPKKEQQAGAIHIRVCAQDARQHTTGRFGAAGGKVQYTL